MDDIYSITKQFLLLYRVPPGAWLLIATGFLVLWTLLMLCLKAHALQGQRRNLAVLRRTKATFVLNLLLMLLGLAVILLVTFVRRGSAGHSVIFYPLRVLYGMQAPSDYWQITIMNFVLYVPFSCGLAFLLGGFSSRYNAARRPAALWTVLICMLLSFLAEAMQYIAGSGLAEVDDVLANTLGGALGTLPFILIKRKQQKGFI